MTKKNGSWPDERKRSREKKLAFDLDKKNAFKRRPSVHYGQT